MNRPDNVPQAAERVAFETFFKTREVPSQFASGVNAMVTVIVCPRCRAVHDDPGVMTTIACAYGLRMRFEYGQTWIWSKEKETAQ